MKIFNRFLVTSLTFAVMVAPAYSMTSAQNSSAQDPAAQQATSTLQRGYRVGYTDGYQAGLRDAADHAARDYRNKEDYRSADRAYTAAYGSLEAYQDGYRQGFEVGYAAGYEHRQFDSTVPPGLSMRGDGSTTTDSSGSSSSNTTISNSSSGNTGVSNSGAGSGPVTAGAAPMFIPRDTIMRVELLTNLSTEASQRGDQFQARVLEPREYEGAVIDGHVTRVKRPGRGHGSAELQLSFDQIRFTDNRSANFNAQVIEVVAGGNSSVRDVDPEGGVRGKGSTTGDIAKVGAGAGIGAIIGAIAGGGRGAAIGAAIGGSIGTAGVLTSRGKEIRLASGQQLRIRTATDTHLQQ